MIHVVLFEPEIPQNTGNIMRTCAATGSKLHLIEPLGFSVDEKAVRRSGMDYRKDVDFHVYSNWQTFKSEHPNGFFVYMTRYGKKTPTQFDYTSTTEDIYLVFGKESTGIDKHILQGQLDRCARLPMIETARSLNLSNCVAICVYEVLRQLDYPGLSTTEVLKGEDWLTNGQFE